MGEWYGRVTAFTLAAVVGTLATVSACSPAGIDGAPGREAGTSPSDASSGGDPEASSISTPDARLPDAPAERQQDSNPADVPRQDAGQEQATPDGGRAPDVSGSDGSFSIESPGVFVGVGYGGRRVRSTDDGMTWIDDVSIAANGGDDDNLLRAVTWGGHQFVALGFRVMTSPNGKDWHDYGTVIGQWIGAVVYAQAQYVGVGGYGLRATSPDGVAWMHHDIDTIASHADSGDTLVFASDLGGRFVSANDDGRRSTSIDGKTWVYGTGATTTQTTDLAFGNGVFVGIGGTSVVLSADGGASWSVAGQVAANVAGLVFAQGHFTATASGHVFTSTDGRIWTDRPVSGLVPGGLVYGHGTYVNVNGLRLRRSSDGISWAPAVVLSGTNTILCMTFGPPA